MRGHEVGLPAFQRFRDAQQSNKIGVVGVEELPRVGTVDAHPVNRTAVLAQIFDVSEDVSMSVLRDEVAEVGAQTL